MGRKILALSLFVPVLVAAVVHAQELDDWQASVEEANRKLDQWIAATRAFIGDVRFGEADLRSFIDNFEAFSSLGEEMGDQEEFIGYDQILADPRYQAWAAATGLAAEPWLKKTTRILAVNMRQQMQAGITAAEAQMPEQRRMIDEQCAAAGAEMCAQMKASLEASMTMLDDARERIDALPQPSASEEELLERYREEMTGLIEDDASGEEYQ